ncbi:MAG: phosphopantothenoylcysteine decarboxylase [Anaerovoracaceae bacterium]
MKRVLITGGPTNEYIDEVMKITNMSTGSLSVTLGDYFRKNGYDVCLVLNNIVNADKLLHADYGKENLRIIRVETTEEMLKALQKEGEQGEAYDIVIHAAAVGDYTGAFSFLMEDMAEEIFAECQRKGGFQSAEEILKIMVDPKCKLKDDSKISSYQGNLTVKLGLTPKIIARLKEWYPEAVLVGCKLLENVPKEELYDVAKELSKKNSMDYILANDLADLRKGDSTRHLVNKEGFTGTKLKTPEDIFVFFNDLIK